MVRRDRSPDNSAINGLLVNGWYDYYDMPPYTSDYDTTFSTPETAPTQPAARCQHSEQTRTVPSANGGTTEVTISRC
jgi:hypothetical protein